MMHREKVTRQCLNVLPVLCALFIVACGSPPPPPSAVDAVVDAHIEARGGLERIAAIEAIRATGTATASGGRIARVIREIKRPDFYRLEFSSQGTKAIFAHDGEVGWQVAPGQGVFEPELVSPEQDSDAGIDERDIEGPLVNWREKGHTVELTGRVTLPGGEADKLKITLADGGVRFDYVDVATHHLVRADKTEMIGGRELVLEERYSDYREVDGLVVPFRIETQVTDRPEAITVVVESVEINPEIDDSRFSFPAAEK